MPSLTADDPAGRRRPAAGDVATRVVAAGRAGGGLLVAIPLLLWWATTRGGLATTLVVPGLVALTVAGLALLAVAAPRRLDRRATVALTALGVLVVLSAASSTWSADRGAATDATLRIALAAGGFGLVVVWPPSMRALRALVVALPLVALVGLVAGLRAAIGDPGSLVDGRLSHPTGYPNATAVLLLGGALAAVAVAADHHRPAVLRGAMAGVAAALLGGALLPQSRSVLLLAGPLALVALVVAPSRGRIAAVGGIATLAVALATPTLLDVRRAALDGVPDPARRGALAVVGLLVAGAIAGLLLTAIERRVTRWWPASNLRARLLRGRRPSASRARAAAARSASWADSSAERSAPRRPRRRVLAVVALVAAIAGIAVAAAHELPAIGDPDYTRIETSGTRFSAGLRSNRPDYWRVAVDLTVADPLRGVGASNFATAYLPRRHARSTPEAAHSSVLGTAAELGVPGLAALLAFALAIAAGVVAAFRVADARDRLTILAAVAPASALALAATVDWSARYPLLALLALAPVAAVLGVGAASRGSTAASPPAPPGPLTASSRRPATASRVTSASVSTSRPTGSAPPRSRLARRHAATATAVLVVAALLAATLYGLRPLAAAQATERAVAAWPVAPDRADAALRRAARLVPNDLRPTLQRGVLDVDRGDFAAATVAMRESLRRGPDGWYPRLALAAIAAHRGDRAAALAWLDAVDAHVAGAQLTNRVRRQLRAGQPVDPREVQQRAFREGP